MSRNDIIAEIHCEREKLARACGYDVKKLMDYYRQREAQQSSVGAEPVPHITPAPTVSDPLILRDAPSKK